MANAYVVPFEFNPTSTTIKTSTYTVPTGFRARVTVESIETDFTIDAVVAIEKIFYSGSFNNNAGGIKFTNTTPYILRGSFYKGFGDGTTSVCYGTTTTTAAVMDTTINSSVGTDRDIGLLIGLNMVLNNTAAGNSGTSYYELSADRVNTNHVFWVPEDTDLNGSRYVVELYPNIT